MKEENGAKSPQEYKLKSVLIHSGRSHKQPSLGKSGVVKIDLSRTDLRDQSLQSLLISANITSITMDKCNLCFFPPIITTLSSVRHISLKSNKIEEFPLNMSVMPNVETILLEENLLNAIPGSFLSFFPRLSKLNVKNNKIIQFFYSEPTSFLKFLDLSYNFFEEFPKCVPYLESLEHLSLQGNNIGDSVSGDLASLINLQSLNLASCELTEFPAVLGSFGQLSRLNLSGNQISNVPASIKSLKNLKILNMSSNRMIQLDENICFCLSLEELNISDNSIDTLPIEISALKRLKKFNISKNRFTKIHYSISALDDLLHLYVSDNHLKSIANPMARINSLVYLNLSGVDLRLLSKELGKFTLLAEIVLENCNLENLEFMNSDSFSRNLEKLEASKNSIQSLPANIDQYSMLKSLSLAENRIQDLPDALSALDNLLELNLADNCFREFPLILASLKKLTKLIFTQENGHKVSEFKVSEDSFCNLSEVYLSHNSISFLPEHSKWLMNVQKLIINNNKLIELPAYVINAQKLQTLEAANNRLTTLPLQMWRLARLTSWNLTGNALKSPPMEFVDEFDIHTVFEHLRVLSDRAGCLFDKFCRIVASSLSWKQFKNFIPKMKLDESLTEKYSSIGRKDPGLESVVYEAMMDYKSTLSYEDITPENVMQLMNRTGNKEVFSVMKNKLTDYSLFTC